MNFRSALVFAVLALCACSERLNSPHSSGGGPPPPPPPPPTGGGGAVHQGFQLAGLLPGADFLQVHWEKRPKTASTIELGIFVSTDAQTLFDGDPVTTSFSSGSMRVTGLSQSTTYSVGCAIRDNGGPWIQSGVPLLARTGVPIYADPAADPGIADGLTPDTAFNDVFLAVVTAFAQGGGNVWMAAGSFESVSFPLLEDVHLYGGFAAGFLPEERDPLDQPTRFLGLAGEYVVRIDVNGDPQVLEGISIDGLDNVSNGIDLSGAPAELRFVEVQRCTRGMSVRNGSFGPNVAVTLYGCTLLNNSLQGTSIKGALDVVVEACDFLSNQGEGLDAGPLQAPENGSASMHVRYCRFLGNGADGLDIDLDAPLGGGVNGGSFAIGVQDCDFVGNGLTGVLIDIEYETAPAWRAEIVVRGCKSRGNLSHGFHLDLDSHAQALLHRNASSANRGDGVHLSSESQSGLVTLSASVAQANAGAGVRATFGNFPLIASHCLIAGNLGGGVVSDTLTSVALSSLAYLQPAPWNGVLRHFSLNIADALPLAFDYPPTQYLAVELANGADISVGAAPNFAVGAIVELDDDETARSATEVETSLVVVDPPSAGESVVLTAFPGVDSVTEDWRLSDASPAHEAGMSAPGGELVDAGVFGGPLAGEAGAEDLPLPALFFVGDVQPAWGELPPNADLSLGFVGGEPDAASLALGCFVVDELGNSLAIGAVVDSGRLLISPPVGGWQVGQWVELYPALTSTAGTALSVPVAIPIL